MPECSTKSLTSLETNKNWRTIMKMTLKSGAAMAATAAALYFSGAVAASAADAAMDAKGHCMGANACKGTGACKTATNACKGQNA